MENDQVQIIRGLPFPAVPWYQKKNIEDTLDYVPHDGDIIIASYPKTGTTWLQYIVLQIVSRGENFPTFDDALTKVVPFMELTGVEAVENMKPPRIYKHHYPYSMVQKNRNAKYLYIYRNPADAVISYYHFMQELRDDLKDFDHFFEGFLTGEVGYGSIFEHVRSYLEHKDDANLLLISYEELLANRKEEVLRIAEFLGEEYFRDVTRDESLLERIIEHTSFDYMKKNLSMTHPFQPQTVNFFRKGTAGDGKKSLSPDQMKQLKEVTAEVMKGTELADKWLKE